VNQEAAPHQVQCTLSCTFVARDAMVFLKCEMLELWLGREPDAKPELTTRWHALMIEVEHHLIQS